MKTANDVSDRECSDSQVRCVMGCTWVRLGVSIWQSILSSWTLSRVRFWGIAICSSGGRPDAHHARPNLVSALRQSLNIPCT